MLRVVLLFFYLGVTLAADTLKIEKADRVGRKIENEFFIADLSHRIVQGQEEDSGTLRALTYKPFGVTFVRLRNRMHWAPNLQRVGAPGYKGLGTWNPVQTVREDHRNGSYIHRREGYLADYPEVKMEAEYRFMPGVPYFVFFSRMTVEKPLEVSLVRNNEMTMDAFFTHVAWPARDGTRHLTTFDDRRPILQKDPIVFDVPWVAFLNLERGYGYGFVALEVEQSKTANAGLGISDGADNGKYWSRRLIGQNTPLAPGDYFEERTAYVLFRTSKDKPLDEFFQREKEIRAQ